MRGVRCERGVWILVLLWAFAAAGCATQPESYAYHPPGFFSGLWHGFTILFGLIANIFSDARIYAYPNSGFGYDLGYFIGAAMFLGGSASRAR